MQCRRIVTQNSHKENSYNEACTEMGDNGKKGPEYCHRNNWDTTLYFNEYIS